VKNWLPPLHSLALALFSSLTLGRKCKRNVDGGMSGLFSEIPQAILLESNLA
jgi:hypothetical protein